MLFLRKEETKGWYLRHNSNYYIIHITMNLQTCSVLLRNKILHASFVLSNYSSLGEMNEIKKKSMIFLIIKANWFCALQNSDSHLFKRFNVGPARHSNTNNPPPVFQLSDKVKNSNISRRYADIHRNRKYFIFLTKKLLQSHRNCKGKTERAL